MLFAVSGIKNSGKTTLITKLLPIFKQNGLKVATIKHDGHDFTGDVPGTDTFKHMASGAYGTAVFSKYRFMAVKQQGDVTERDLCQLFPEADLILLEGFKESRYPKIEVVREGVSARPVCDEEHLLAVASDFTPKGCETIPVLNLDDPIEIAEVILDYWYSKTQLSLVLLAGGKGSRMGSDKTTLNFFGKTFLECQLEKGKKLGIQDMMASGCQVTNPQCRFIPDRQTDKGPLGGLETSLREAVNEQCLVLGVDIPAVPVSELWKLIRTYRKSKMPVAVLKHQNRTEPLIGIYAKNLAEEISLFLKSSCRVMSFLESKEFAVYESTLEEKWFLNVNNPQAYEALTAFVGEYLNEGGKNTRK